MQGRWLLLSAGCMLLAACASGPKKDASESVALPDDTPVRREGLPDGRRSPYAPAREDVSKRGHYTAGGLYARLWSRQSGGFLPVDHDAADAAE